VPAATTPTPLLKNPTTYMVLGALVFAGMVINSVRKSHREDIKNASYIGYTSKTSPGEPPVRLIQDIAFYLLTLTYRSTAPRFRTDANASFLSNNHMDEALMIHFVQDM
jgi:hypothetical protein